MALSMTSRQHTDGSPEKGSGSRRNFLGLFTIMVGMLVTGSVDHFW
jgi:hypothetical protein